MVSTTGGGHIESSGNVYSLGNVYKYRLESLLLENGFEFEPGKLTVVVGPNNSGKSRLLRDVKDLCTGQTSSTVVAKEVKYSKPPNPAALMTSYDVRPEFDFRTGQTTIETLDADMTNISRVNIPYPPSENREDSYKEFVKSLIDSWDHQGATEFATYFGNLFITRLTTESRLLLAKEGPSGSEFGEATHLLRALYEAGKEVEEKLSTLIERAFNTRVKLDYTNLTTLCLRIGEDFTEVSDDPREAKELLESFDRLEEQGDGMRSFATTILSLLVGDKPVLLLDEPEAFLHPPQASQLGAMIAEQTTEQRQAFVATHSVDLLRGILNETSDVDLIRLSRTSDGMQVNKLGLAEVREIANHPLLSSTRVLDGLFYKGAVVVEADSDSAFYQRVASVERPGDEIHYTHAHNKQTLHKVVRPYKSMGVKIVSVPDFDILREQRELKALLDAATDEDTTEILNAQEQIRTEVENTPITEQLNLLRERLDKLASEPSESAQETESEALNDLKRDVKKAVQDSNLWNIYKKEGREALSEDGARAFDRLNEFCKARGIFIVPCGELESWMVPYGLDRMSNKNRWIVQALEMLGNTDLPEDSELVEFVTSIHEHLLA